MSAQRAIAADTGSASEGGWRARFAAWWKGAAGSSESKRLAQRLDRPKMPAALMSEADRERIMRIEAPQVVWGTGNSAPGTMSFYEKLMGPVDLNSERHVLLVGAGLGGAGRMLHDRFGCTVLGLEATASVAAKANELSAQAALSGKVDIRAFNPEGAKIKARSADCVLVEPLLFTVQNKLDLLRELDLALKGTAQIVLLDYVLGALTEANNEDWRAWTESERPEPKVRTMGEQKALFKKAKLRLRQANDITGVYNRMIVKAWASCLDHLESRPRAEQQTDPVLRGVAELAEFWARRAALMEMGALKVVRFQLGRAKFGGK